MREEFYFYLSKYEALVTLEKVPEREFSFSEESVDELKKIILKVANENYV